MKSVRWFLTGVLLVVGMAACSEVFAQSKTRGEAFRDCNAWFTGSPSGISATNFYTNYCANGKGGLALSHCVTEAAADAQSGIYRPQFVCGDGHVTTHSTIFGWQRGCDTEPNIWAEHLPTDEFGNCANGCEYGETGDYVRVSGAFGFGEIQHTEMEPTGGVCLDDEIDDAGDLFQNPPEPPGHASRDNRQVCMYSERLQGVICVAWDEGPTCNVSGDAAICAGDPPTPATPPPDPYTDWDPVESIDVEDSRSDPPININITVSEGGGDGGEPPPEPPPEEPCEGPECEPPPPCEGPECEPPPPCEGPECDPPGGEGPGDGGGGGVGEPPCEGPDCNGGGGGGGEGANCGTAGQPPCPGGEGPGDGGGSGGDCGGVGEPACPPGEEPPPPSCPPEDLFCNPPNPCDDVPELCEPEPEPEPPPPASPGAGCDSPPSCSAEPVLCATLYEVWRGACAWDGADAGLGDGSDFGKDRDPGTVVLPNQEIDGSSLDASGWLIGGDCPVPVSIEIFGTSYETPHADLCAFLSLGGWLVLLAAYVAGLRILAGG